MKAHLLSFILMLPVLAVAQNNVQHQKDSMKNVIATTKGEEKLKTYRKLTNIYYSESRADSLKMDTLLTLYKQMFDEAVQQNNIDFQGIARVNTLGAFSNRYAFDEVLKRAPEYLDYLEKKEAWKYYFVVYNKFIEAYLWTDDYDTGLAKAKEMYEKAKKNEYNIGIGLALFMMSNAYEFMSRYEEEEKYMRESIEILRKEDVTMLPFVASGYYYLCNSLMLQERYRDALREAKEFEKINHLYEEASRTEQPTTWSNLYRILFLAYIGISDFNNAEMYYRKLERINGGVKDDISIAQGWATIYEGRKQYEKALEMLDKQIMLNGDINSLERNVTIPKNKARILAKMGRAQEVYDLYSQIFIANDSIRNTEFNAQLDELRTVYEVDKITAENELNRIQKIRNRNYFLFALGGCALLAFALGIWIYHSRAIVRKNRGLYLQIKEQDRLAEKLEREREESRQLRRLIQPEATGLPKEDDDIFFERLTVLMKEQQLYTGSEVKRQDIAGKIGLSDRRLHDCVKNNTGMSFAEYINTLRLAHSRELLSRPDENLTIEAIALDSGFNSRATFYRLFNEKYGLSPKQFKEFVK